MVRAVALNCRTVDWLHLVFVLVMGLFGGCASPGEASGDRAPSEAATRLMNAYSQAARDGDFEYAWRTYIRLFERLHDSRLEAGLFEDHCRTVIDCPAIAEIAWILGKSQADIARLDELGCLNGQTNPSCERWHEWAAFRKTFLAGSASRPTHPVQELNFDFIHAEAHGDMRPWTIVKLSGSPFWAILDTGGYKLKISKNSPAASANVDSRGRPFRYLSPLGDYRLHQPVVLREFALGSVVEDRIPAVMIENLSSSTAIVGMNALLRYSKVCFSWPDRRLHLGSLGPCSEGEEPYQGAGLRLGSIPTVRVRPSRGSAFQLAIDTGSPQTLCQDRFIERMGGRRFRFGHHIAFEAICADSANHELVSSEPEARAWDVPAVIGMDTLIKFDAFGWELNPFRLYFVPKGRPDS